MTLMDTIHEIKLDSIFSSPESLPSLSLSISGFEEKLPLISSSLAPPGLPFLPPISSLGIAPRGLNGARNCAGLGQSTSCGSPWDGREHRQPQAEYTARTI